MSKRSKAIAVAEKALEALEVELALHQNGRGTVSSPDELQCFKSHIMEILAQLRSNQVSARDIRKFGMGHAIADSWPLDSQLGELLCYAEQAYRNS